MEVKLGIDKENRKGSVKLLSVVLADVTVLYFKTLNYHWNVRGFHFGPLHKLFKKQYEQLAEWIDEIAERIRMLGEFSPGSMKELLSLTRLEEDKGEGRAEKAMLSSLLADYEAIIRNLRVDIEVADDKFKDMGTSDFFTGLIQKHEQIAWMLRVHLEGNEKC
ncbi:MAG: DNA protection during starvation protein 2 [Chlamydiae bacterium]|nr:DNA protection during starvation protein 2 [Chlamydiota bacterium]